MFSSPGYRLSPPAIQELLIAARSFTRRLLREGPSFRAKLAEIQETQWLPTGALAAWSQRRLNATLQHATTTVPYYAAQIGRSRAPVPLDAFPLMS